MAELESKINFQGFVDPSDRGCVEMVHKFIEKYAGHRGLESIRNLNRGVVGERRVEIGTSLLAEALNYFEIK